MDNPGASKPKHTVRREVGLIRCFSGSAGCERCVARRARDEVCNRRHKPLIEGLIWSAGSTSHSRFRADKHLLCRPLLQQGRRLLEYGDALTEAAIATLRERNRLRNAERVLARWVDILSGLYPRGMQTADAPAPPPTGLPNALRIAEPDIADARLAALAQANAVEPGWCVHAAEALAHLVLADEAEDLMWQDDGLAGGALARLHDELRSGDRARTWWLDRAYDGIDRVREEIGADKQRLVFASGDSGPEATVRSFLEQVTEAGEYDPGRDFAGHLSADKSGKRVHVEGRVLSGEIALSPEITRAAVVVILDRFRRSDEPRDHGDDAPISPYM